MRPFCELPYNAESRWFRLRRQNNTAATIRSSAMISPTINPATFPGLDVKLALSVEAAAVAVGDEVFVAMEVAAVVVMVWKVEVVDGADDDFVAEFIDVYTFCQQL
jgi:hypothetical protein